MHKWIYMMGFQMLELVDCIERPTYCWAMAGVYPVLSLRQGYDADSLRLQELGCTLNTLALLGDR